MSISALSTSPANETFGKDASFKLEQPIGSMSISPSGRDVVLASKEGLHIIDLDSPYSPPRFLPHRTPWEVADVQWSPFATRDYWVVSTSNQKALVWNLGAHGWRKSIEFILHGHTRAITDINFSAFHADILATCAVDSFVHCWDLRNPTKPAFSFSDWFAGATQVKWSRQDEHVVASTHDKSLHIWDKRNGAYPLRTIQAHDTKIYGIDWNRFEPSKIVTCSLDRTIKFWNTQHEEDIPERIIQTPFPVWRARHTPFGWGLMVMPQRGSADLHLYDRRPVNGVLESGPVRPVHSFSGHKGQVKEFLWRASGTVKEGIDHRDFQLVSWGTDRELKLHSVSPETLADIGYEQGVSKTQRLQFTRRGARYRTFRDEIREPSSPHELSHRADSSSTVGQYLQVRGRPSTNIGMSKFQISQFRGWVQASKRQQRTGMHGKGNLRRDLDPISWMKNVKIASWNTDSLADELTQIGEKFKRVEFESVDVSQRKVTMSLQGPWGDQGVPVYTRVDFRFPKTYPRGARAIFQVQNTNAMSDDTHNKLSAEMLMITETFFAQGRGCIEAIVRYLLREQTVDQIKSWALGDSLSDSKILDRDIADDASSDSDDDQIDAVANAANSSANIRVPLAKGCAALWSETGKLVCFFVPKTKETTSSFMSTLGTGRLDESESGKLFGGFGKFQVDSQARKTKSGTKEDHGDSNSDTSDSSSTFSSSSSSSSSDEVVLHDKFETYRPNILGAPKRTKSPDGSNKSTTLDGTKMGELNRMNVISIHDFEFLLPAKKSVAEEYKVLGNAPELCRHNAKIAEMNSLPEISSVWRLAALILEGNIPLELQKMPGKSEEEIIVLARETSILLKTKVGSTGLDANPTRSNTITKIRGRARWGASPLGPAYMLPAMFQYFEAKADIQTLAMLSCIFIQAESEMDYDTAGSNKNRLPLHTPTDRYFVSPEIAHSLVHGVSPGERLSGSENAMRRAETPAVTPPSNSFHFRRRSMGSAAVSTRVSPMFTGESHTPSQAPNVVKEDPSGIIAPIHSSAASLSSSPNESRLHERTDSSTAFPLSKATLSALAKAYSNSPPSKVTNTDISGTDSSSRATRGTTDYSAITEESHPQLRSSRTMINLPSARHDGTKTPDTSRGSIRSILKTDKAARKSSSSNKKRKMKANVYNQDLFDLDNQPTAPLIPPHMREKCILYQVQYAQLLEMWQLWRQRAEMLQVCSRTERTPGRTRSRAASLAAPPEVASVRTLEIRRCCPACGNTLAPIEKNGIAIGWHCIDVNCPSSSRKLSRRQACSVCEVVVRGLAVPCLQCGHLTCYECAHGWFLAHDDRHRASSVGSNVSVSRSAMHTSHTDKGNADHRTCPTGCGCSCPELTTIDVPYPLVREEQQQEEASTTPMTKIESHHSGSGPTTAQGARVRSNRLMSSTGPDKAISALLSIGNRSNSISTKTSATIATNHISGDREPEPHSANDELLPWAKLHGGTLGKGMGAGLSRGLSSKASDSTIRKAPM